MLYARVAEVPERVRADGAIETPLDRRRHARRASKPPAPTGIDAVAIVFMHAYAFPDHEREAALARPRSWLRADLGESRVSPLVKFVGRGDTTVVDAYLSPLLRRYVDRVAAALSSEVSKTKLLFMQSSGGLTSAHLFKGKDAILSGPAGGVVGAVETARIAGFDRDHRLRHGRHLDRCLPFRRRLRADLRERGRGRARARADDADPYSRGRRRLDPAL